MLRTSQYVANYRHHLMQLGELCLLRRTAKLQFHRQMLRLDHAISIVFG